MSILKACLLFCALLAVTEVYPQQTDLFVALQTGSPFRVINDNNEPLLMNLNLGVEQYMIEKLSLALSYRKVFYFIGKTNNVEPKTVFNYDGWNYAYTEDYDSYAIDFESKYFFEGPNDDGAYISSCISFQHITMNINMFSIEPSGASGSSLPAIPLGKFKDEMNIYPFGIKIGARNASDELVFDYFLGIMYHFGAAGIHRAHEDILDYFPLKSVSFPIGVKLGFKF